MGPIADGRRQLRRQWKVAKRHEVRDRFIPSLSRKRLFIQEMRVPSGHQRKWSGQLKSIHGAESARHHGEEDRPTPAPGAHILFGETENKQTNLLTGTIISGVNQCDKINKQGLPWWSSG